MSSGRQGLSACISLTRCNLSCYSLSKWSATNIPLYKRQTIPVLGGFKLCSPASRYSGIFPQCCILKKICGTTSKGWSHYISIIIWEFMTGFMQNFCNSDWYGRERCPKPLWVQIALKQDSWMYRWVSYFQSFEEKELDSCFLKWSGNTHYHCHKVKERVEASKD